LQVHWGPIFKKYKLDFYLCGHDHDLQQLTVPDWWTSFILAGGMGSSSTGVIGRPQQVEPSALPT